MHGICICKKEFSPTGIAGGIQVATLEDGVLYVPYTVP